MLYFLQGLTMGLAYVAPIGLQNLFIINTSISMSKSRAYLTALIVIFFDVTLALACFFGIGALIETYNWLKLIILGVGSIIVIYIGIGILREKGSLSGGKDVNIPIVKVISTACVVTWFNPQALIDGSMMLGAFRVTLPPSESTPFIIGVAIASICWFMTITTIVSILGGKITPKVLRVINVICGSIIVIYGLKLAFDFVKMII